MGPMARQQMAALDKCKSYNETFQKIVLGMTKCVHQLHLDHTTHWHEYIVTVQNLNEGVTLSVTTFDKLTEHCIKNFH